MKSKTVQTTNLRALIRAHQQILSRSPGQPGIAVVHGAAGFGKSTAVLWLSNECNGLQLEASPLWSPRWMLSDIIKELGGSPPYLTQGRYEFIIESLRLDPRPIFIDEADRIARSEVLVETLRAIHDRTRAPIILIGMDQFKKRAAMRPQLHRRIVKEVEFKAMTIEDARLLARELCEIEIQDDLVADLKERSRGSIGLFRNMLADAETAARKNGAKVLRLADYAREA